MRNNSPRKLALLFAGIYTVLFFLFGFVLIREWLPGSIFTIIMGSAVIFTFSFLLLLYILRSYIYEKIRPLYRVIRKSGKQSKKTNIVSDSANPIKDVYSDVGDWAKNKMSEIAQLKANEKFRKEFIGNVSHELKTPIFNIQGYILTLLEGGLDDKSVNTLYLERAEKSINRMIHIVRDLEDIALLETGELALDMEEFDLIRLVEEVLELNEMRAKKRGIELSLMGEKDRVILVYADRIRILEVISNLLVNGIAYGNNGGWVHIDFVDIDQHVMVEVADNGVGINEKDQKRIFERFYRVDKSRSREEGGTGLGLAISKHFVEAHGHTINLRSEKGKGTAFSFMLNKSKT